MTTTNYYNYLIQIAEDSPALCGEIPGPRGNKPTVAQMQYQMLQGNPYKYSSDDVLFTVYADRKDIAAAERAKAREEFFSKGQPCFRASPLTKRYGWGIHSDSEGKIAMYSVDSDEYQRLLNDPAVEKARAMRSQRG